MMGVLIAIIIFGILSYLYYKKYIASSATSVPSATPVVNPVNNTVSVPVVTPPITTVNNPVSVPAAVLTVTPPITPAVNPVVNPAAVPTVTPPITTVNNPSTVPPAAPVVTPAKTYLPRPVINDCGYRNAVRGWFDYQGQGVPNDYCSYISDPPNIFFACSLAGGDGYHPADVKQAIGRTPHPVISADDRCAGDIAMNYMNGMGGVQAITM